MRKVELAGAEMQQRFFAAPNLSSSSGKPLWWPHRCIAVAEGGRAGRSSAAALRRVPDAGSLEL